MADKLKSKVPKGEKGSVVIQGHHPEMALIHTMGYNNSDPYLESKPRPTHLKYNGPKAPELADKRPL